MPAATRPAMATYMTGFDDASSYTKAAEATSSCAASVAARMPPKGTVNSTMPATANRVPIWPNHGCSSRSRWPSPKAAKTASAMPSRPTTRAISTRPGAAAQPVRRSTVSPVNRGAMRKAMPRNSGAAIMLMPANMRRRRSSSVVSMTPPTGRRREPSTPRRRYAGRHRTGRAEGPGRRPDGRRRQAGPSTDRPRSLSTSSAWVPSASTRTCRRPPATGRSRTSSQVKGKGASGRRVSVPCGTWTSSPRQVRSSRRPGPGGPGLWAARRGVGHGVAAGRPGDATEELGEAVAEVRREAQQAGEQAAGRLVVAGAREPPRGDGGVVRPHRPAVVAQRVEAGRRGGHGPQAPPRAERRSPESLGHQRPARPGRAGRTAAGGPCCSPGASTGTFVGVQRDRREPPCVVLHPEVLAEPSTHRRGPRPPLVAAGAAVVVEQLGAPQRGVVGVALHLGQRDRGPCDASVGELDAVVAVLPALVVQATLAGPQVLEEPVAVGVRVVAEPPQGGLHVGQQRLDLVRGQPEPPRLGERDDEQRGRVDAAVVVGGQVAAMSEAAPPDLVQDLAGCLLGLGVVPQPLPAGQGAQRAARQCSCRWSATSWPPTASPGRRGSGTTGCRRRRTGPSAPAGPRPRGRPGRRRCVGATAACGARSSPPVGPGGRTSPARPGGRGPRSGTVGWRVRTRPRRRCRGTAGEWRVVARSSSHPSAWPERCAGGGP